MASTSSSLQFTVPVGRRPVFTASSLTSEVWFLWTMMIHRKPPLTLEKPWGDPPNAIRMLWKTMGKPWETHGKPMGNPWENVGHLPSEWDQIGMTRRPLARPVSSPRGGRHFKVGIERPCSQNPGLQIIGVRSRHFHLTGSKN